MWQSVRVHNPYGPHSKYIHKRVQSPGRFDPRSMRTISANPKHTKLIIGCPKGFYSPSKRTCKVGTEVQAILKPKKNPKGFRMGVHRKWLSKHPVKRYVKGRHGEDIVYYGVKRKNVRARRRYSTREGTLRKKSKATRVFKGRIPSRSLLFQGVFGKATTKSIKRHLKKTGQWKRNQSLVSDAIAGDISKKIVSKVEKYFKVASPARHKKRSAPKRRRRKNPHLAIIGVNPRRKKMARRRRRLPRRNARGRFVKATAKRRRRRNVVKVNRRRRHTRAAPRRRRRNVRVTVRYRRRRYNKMASRKRRHHRRRRHNVVHRRRYTRARSPNVHRRRHRSNPRRRHHRRRRNPSLSGLFGRVNFMQVVEVAGGVFLGDKLTTYLGNTVTTWLGVTDATMSGAIKAGLGVVTAGLLWKVRPALALGVAVGAANGLLNQYVFAPLWGYASPYLPSGMAGMGDYVNRGWKVDNWLPGTSAVAGLGRAGNPLLTKGL